MERHEQRIDRAENLPFPSLTPPSLVVGSGPFVGCGPVGPAVVGPGGKVEGCWVGGFVGGCVGGFVGGLVGG